MKRRALLTALLPLCLALGCSYTGWNYKNRVRSYPVPGGVPIIITMSSVVVATDESGYTATLMQVIEADLVKSARRAKVLTDRPKQLPQPRVELFLHRLDESTMPGEGPLIVDCHVFSEENQEVFSGRVGGPFRPGGAKAAGHLIVQELLGGGA